eukprot:sb/3475140/
MLGELLFNQGNASQHILDLKNVLVKHKDCFYPVFQMLAVTSWAQATKTAQANLYYLQQTCPTLILSTLTLRNLDNSQSDKHFTKVIPHHQVGDELKLKPQCDNHSGPGKAPRPEHNPNSRITYHVSYWG